MASRSEVGVHIVSVKIAFSLGLPLLGSFIMPVIGLSAVLENTVISVLKTHSLKSWNLFSEDNGNVTIRLKFNILEEPHIPQHTEGSNQDVQSTISFKKKNAKQISRDKARARKRKRLRQSSSSIEINMGQSSKLDQHEMDTIISPLGHKVKVNDPILQSTPNNLEIPDMVQEVSTDSDDEFTDEMDMVVSTVEAQIDVPSMDLDEEKADIVRDPENEEVTDSDNDSSSSESDFMNEFFSDSSGHDIKPDKQKSAKT